MGEADGELATAHAEAARQAARTRAVEMEAEERLEAMRTEHAVLQEEFEAARAVASRLGERVRAAEQALAAQRAEAEHERMRLTADMRGLARAVLRIQSSSVGDAVRHGAGSTDGRRASPSKGKTTSRSSPPHHPPFAPPPPPL